MVITPARHVGGRARDVVAPVLRRLWPRPRIRRPVDMARLVIAAAVLALLITLAALHSAALQATVDLFPTVDSGVPRTVLSIVNVVVSLGVVALLVLVAIQAARLRPFVLTCAVLAG